MTKILLISFILSTGHLFSQQADSLMFNRVFGCSCCSDTLRNLTDKRWVYILSENKSRLTAYRSGKGKWTITNDQIWKGNHATIDCMGLYEIDKRIVLRLFSDNVKGHADINMKTGKQFDKKVR